MHQSGMIGEIFSKSFLLSLKQELQPGNLSQGAAALAYYLTLAVFPALILLMTTVPFLPIENLEQAIMKWFEQALPQQAYSIVEQVVRDVLTDRRGGLLSFGLLGSIWITSIGMYAVMRQLNSTYRVEESRSFLRAWGTALLLSFLFGSLLLSAFSLIVLGGVVEGWLGQHFGFSDLLVSMFSAFRWFIIVAAMLLGFALIYHLGPAVKPKFHFVTSGSLIGVIVLIIASLLFSFYTRNFAAYDAIYGSIGAIIVLMIWLYIVGFVVLLGSKINAILEQYCSRNSSRGTAD